MAEIEPRTDFVRLTVEGDVATVRLCAPQTRNAFTVDGMRGLADAIRSADSSGAALIVLEAEGPDFSVGRAPQEAGISLEETLGEAIATNGAWAATEAVTLTVVKGTALGFAFGLVAQSDLAVATTDARFAFDEMERGFVPKIVLSYLPELLPRSVALDLVLSARSLTARQVQELGLVGRVVPTAELRDAVGEYTATLVGNGRAALLRDAKEYVGRAMARPPEERGEFALAESIRSMS